MKALYDRRKETVERVFADAKEKHGMRFTYYRGLSQVTKWVRLKFAAMNLKKYATHRWKGLLFISISASKIHIIRIWHNSDPVFDLNSGFVYRLKSASRAGYFFWGSFATEDKGTCFVGAGYR